ncbi:signal peptidase I [Paraburkholderia xenovorans LB400]|uniref:Signal peptidase I n=1 Tax=Paraburkholderia xenovorans (strain LB400) TaxID=266265 RepID=Q13ZM6_PARXL|nr:signal peptidase I [Paraburkholderia xenovorans]ABE30463.1 signal peptidase I, Serine peptidase, MEROPS family S26A [Paraburkholderia xenovorans LB400]AIP33606.1 signal peptidase I [Paraburkholderia xenovorans LB400]
MRMLGKLWRDNKSLVAFLFLMVLFRSAVADWNVVPSGSMLPTIREGDRIFVDKMAYDLRVPLTHIAIAHLHDPQRGDIVTIDSSAAHELIVKRLIGLPGDSVAMRENVLYVNGVRADYQPLKFKPLPGDASSPGDYLTERFDGIAHIVRLAPQAPSPRDSFGPVIVPPGEYLMLGDNRDDSADSRYFGFFSRKELMGRTRRVAYSLDPDHYYAPRFERFGARLDSSASAVASR